MSVLWLNGELVDAAEARINVLDRGVLWGYGLFETLRAYGGRVWAGDEHLERLAAGSDALDLPVPAPRVLLEAMGSVLEANALSDAGVRITVTRGAGPPDPHDDPTEPPNAFVTAWPLRDYSELYRQGVALASVHGGGRTLAGFKTTSYAVSVVGRIEARRAGAEDALFVGAGGEVLEATGSNLVAIFGNEARTPPVDGGILPGVTRSKVLEVASTIGLRVSEDVLRTEELFEADEVLLTSSLREVYAARSLDGRTFQRGPFEARLREAFRDAIRRELGV